MGRPQENIRSLFEFESVAIVGASDDPDRIGGIPLALLLRYGFEGRIYGVNPKYETVQGVPCMASPSALPEDVEVVVFAVPAKLVVRLFPEFCTRGIKGAVVLSAGFAEAGPDGRQLQAELSRMAEQYGVAVLGPNCVGQISFGSGHVLALATPWKVLPMFPPGRVALLSQSGGIAGNIWADAVLAGARFSHVITTGNEAVLSFADYLEYLADDPETDVVLGYIEALKDGPRFCEAAARFRAAGKPLVLIKVGSSEIGQNAVRSHTGMMSTPDSGYEAAFERYSVIRASSLQDLTDYSRVFAMANLRPKLTVGTTTGGTAVYVADVATELGIPLTKFRKETVAQIEEIIPSFGRARNPADLTMQVVNDPEMLERTIDLFMAEPETGVVLFLLAGKGGETQSKEVISTFGRLQERAPKPLVLGWLGVTDEVRRRGAEAGLRVFADPRRFLKPLSAVYRVQAAPQAAPRRPPPRGRAGAAKPQLNPSDLATGESGRAILDEWRSMALIEEAGVSTPRRWRVTSDDDLQAAAEAARFPCVAKPLEPVLAHRSDVGAVVTGIASAEALAEVWQRMHREFAAKVMLVAEQSAPGLEILVGAVRDPTFRQRIVVGAGGIWTNYTADSVTLIPPLDESYVEERLRRLKLWGRLAGERGQSALALGRLVATIQAIGEVARRERHVLDEFECNPIIVTEADAIAVDAVGMGPEAAEGDLE